MTTPTMTTTRELGRCPACGKPFTARVQMSVELTDYPAAEGQFVLDETGAYFEVVIVDEEDA